MASPIVLDVLFNREKGWAWDHEQMAIVVDHMPEIRFRREGDRLLGNDGPFYQAYGYERPTQYSKAFGGSEFDIPLIDGGVEKAKGQWWCISHPKVDGVRFVDPGYNTADGLAKCPVFVGGCLVDSRIVEDWLKTSTPSWDYHKYDTRRIEPPRPSPDLSLAELNDAAREFGSEFTGDRYYVTPKEDYPIQLADLLEDRGSHWCELLRFSKRNERKDVLCYGYKLVA